MTTAKTRGPSVARVLSVFYLPLLLQAMPGSPAITGRVVSSATLTPLAAVNIQLAGDPVHGAVAGIDGRFVLDLESFPATLLFSRIGYADTTVVVSSHRHVDVRMRPVVLTGETVQIEVLRAVRGITPVAFSTLDRESLERNYSHQDVPMVLAGEPGVYAYSDAGNGVGYTYLNIRGFSQDRIGVYLNGIPLNDPEAHAVYWVDHGDILADAGDIQLQRGVGNSLYGTGVFGGTVNLSTGGSNQTPGWKLTAGYGDYTQRALNLPSRKLSVSFTSNPRIGGAWQTFGRISSLSSAGYRVGSGAEQLSARLGAERATAGSLTKLEALWGHEVTAFSWEGVIPAYGYDLRNRDDRRYNYYADPAYNAGRDDANKDVFTQSIISLQHSRKWGQTLASLTLYNVSGDGFFEQAKIDREVGEYNLAGIVPAGTEVIDLLRRRWLRNGYYGAVGHVRVPLGRLKLTLGGDLRVYGADHYGQVTQVLSAPATVSAGHRYYSDTSEKLSFSLFTHSLWELTSSLQVVAGLRYLGHRYGYRQSRLGAFTEGYQFDLRYDFLDPHFGLVYDLSSGINLFVNVSTAQREPANSDIYDHDDPGAVPAVRNMENRWADPLVQSESLTDFEWGLNLNRQSWSAEINLYRMDLRNELIPAYYRYTDADELFHANAPRTVHQGVETSFDLRPNPWLSVSGNLTYADNRFVEFTGDSLGWEGFGGISDYAGKTVPAFPRWQGRLSVVARFRSGEGWLQLQQVGRQYIDFLNTDSVAIAPFGLASAGISLNLPRVRNMSVQVKLRVENIFDRLYETFGYTYFEGSPPRQVAAYWPGATRRYFLELQLRR